MHRKTLLATAAALLLAGSSMIAVAQDAPAASPGAPKAAMSQQHGWKDGAKGRDGRDEHRGFGDHGMDGHHRSPVIGDLRSIERLYMIEGKTKELPALYNEVLAKSKNPMVRDYVYHRLARIQAQPANVDQAIATMRKSLDENLARDEEMRAKMEQFRSQWQQKHADGAAKQ